MMGKTSSANAFSKTIFNKTHPHTHNCSSAISIPTSDSLWWWNKLAFQRHGNLKNQKPSTQQQHCYTQGMTNQGNFNGSPPTTETKQIDKETDGERTS
jgi:hypothetical protein